MLSLIAVALVAAAPALADARLTGNWIWPAESLPVPGLSALELGPDGQDFQTLADRGTLYVGSFRRAGEDLDRIEVTSHRLKDTDGRPLKGKLADSEGLAVAPDGTIFISFEGRTRIWRYDGPDAVPTPLPKPADFDRFGNNTGLEALAIGPDGALYTIPEVPNGRSFPVYRYAHHRWTAPFRIRASEGFRVTGADVGPDGRLYVLERHFAGFGFRTRVRRFDLSGGSEVVLLETSIGTHNNLEGLAVWRDVTGAMRLTMVGDNNGYDWLLPSEIVEYRLDPPRAGG